MSIKERMEAIKGDRERAERLTEEEKRRKEAAWSAKYQQEFPRVRCQQAALLEEMRALGIVAMVEEVVEKVIEPILDSDQEEKRQEPTAVQLEEFWRKIMEPTAEEMKEREHRIKDALRPRKWLAHILYPNLSEEGVWESALKIEITNNPRFDLSLRALSKRESPKVLLEYSEGGDLTVSGEKVTFSGKVSADLAERSEVIETALAKALLEPKRAKSVPFFRDLSTIRYRAIGS